MKPLNLLSVRLDKYRDRLRGPDVDSLNLAIVIFDHLLTDQITENVQDLIMKEAKNLYVETNW